MKARLLIIGVLVGLLGLATVGCSGGGDSEDQGADSTIVMNRASDLFGFDPNSPLIEHADIQTDLQVYDRLVELGPDNKSIVPGLATSWKSSDDGHALTFTLRSGVKFSDGSPLTANDVVFSLKRNVTPVGLGEFLFGGSVKSVAAPDSRHVTISFSRPYTPALYALASWIGSIYSEANWKKWGTDKVAAQHPLGTGAYMVQKWIKGREVQIVPNPHYWGKKPQVEKVVFKVVGEENARVLQLRSGAADIVETVPPSQAESVRNTGAQVQAVNGAGIALIALNQKVKAFQDKNVRLALAYALNRAAVAKAAYFGLAKPATSAFPSGTLYHSPTGAIGYDMTKARSYLARSAYPNGFSFKILVSSADGPAATTAQIWGDSLKTLGIDLKVEPLEDATAQTQWSAEKYEAFFDTYTNDTPHPFEFTRLCFAGENTFHTGFKFPGAEALATKAETTTSEAERQAVYTKIQKLINTEVPYISVVDLPLLFASSPKIEGFAPNYVGSYAFQNVSIKP